MSFKIAEIMKSEWCLSRFVDCQWNFDIKKIVRLLWSIIGDD